eukprot:762423-Hanusia_phi.AAC.3
MQLVQPDEESDDEESVLLSEKDLMQYLKRTEMKEGYLEAQKSLPALSTSGSNDGSITDVSAANRIP